MLNITNLVQCFSLYGFTEFFYCFYVEITTAETNYARHFISSKRSNGVL